MPRAEDHFGRAAAGLAARLPAPLEVFARLAYNYRWSWMPGGSELFRAIDPHRWELCGQNPVRLLQEAAAESLVTAARDEALLARAHAMDAAVAADLARDPYLGPLSPARPAAFFCAEYAIHRSLPVYSGGLGALAGDFLKEASDRALPLIAVGLMYRTGYFRQRIDVTGWQHEYWVDTDPDRAPAALVTGDDGLPMTVVVPIRGRDVVAQVWRVEIGRIPLYLLDAERPENDRVSRWITSRLYVGDPATRLAQYVLLGVGGMRALHAMDIEPGLIHLNEGHAAFAALELARNSSREDARARAVFTTHTPVPAGNDTYPADDIRETLGAVAQECGYDVDELVRLGRTRPDDDEEPFGVTQFALRTTRGANGVSRRHGVVAREMWRPLWPDRPDDEVPIGHVTNGVHLPTWIGEPMLALLDRHLGPGWLEGAVDPQTWAALEDASDEELWEVRCAQRSALVEYVRDHSVADRLTRGESRDYVEAAARAFDPDVLTLGFARRVATYKRLYLLLSDRDRSLAMLAGERPVQIVIAGKAHPRDDEAKHVVQGLFTAKGPTAGRVVFLHDYDLGMAATLVQGCDVWVNLPRAPLEACGTSGMKSAVNGGLQLSVSDGWWDEAGEDGDARARAGWTISGEVLEDPHAQDARDAQELYELLERSVLPEFYDRDPAGLPRHWVARMRASLRALPPQFGAGRMIEDYLDDVYAPPAAVRA